MIPEKKIQPSNWSIFFVHPVFSFAIYQIFTRSEIGNTNGRVLENSVNSAKLHQRISFEKKIILSIHVCRCNLVEPHVYIICTRDPLVGFFERIGRR